MPQVSIPVSDEELTLARERAKSLGFASVEAYVTELVTRRLRREEDSEFSEGKIPEDSKEQLKALILEGLATPSRERTKEDFDKVRQEIIERHQQARAG